MRKTPLLMALALLSALPSAHAQRIPSGPTRIIAAKVNQWGSVSLQPGQRQDFNFNLPLGQFTLYVDARRPGERSLTTSIDASVRLLNLNGSAAPQYSGDFIYFNTHENETRVGKSFYIKKPTGVRFRITNKSDGVNYYWLKVVKASPVQFVPFAFNAPVQDAKIGSSNGTGGKLGFRHYSYLRATIPAGKWSISLGATEAEGRCYATLASLDSRGLDYEGSFLIIATADDTGGEARKEEIVTFSKSTTLIFKVLNEGATTENPITYDVTIEPSTG